MADVSGFALCFLRCCVEGFLWEELWKALTYCHDWFQLSLAMKTSALQALRNDPKHLLPLAAPWIIAQDVTSLTLIQKDVSSQLDKQVLILCLFGTFMFVYNMKIIHNGTEPFW